MHHTGKSREALLAEIRILEKKIHQLEEKFEPAKHGLGNSEDRYQALFQSYNSIKLIIRVSTGQIIDANQAASDFYGYTRDELLSKKAWEINSLSREEILEILKSTQNRKKSTYEFQHILKSGEIRDVEVFTAPFEQDGEIFLFSIVNDITQRKQAELELREREARLRVIFDTSHAGILMVDPRGIISFANKRMAEMFGCTMKELIGSSYSDYLHPEYRSNCLDIMYRMFSGEQDYVAMEKKYLRCNGNSFWGYLSAGRLEADDKSLIALVVVITDITGRKEFEKSLRESEERYRHLVELSPEAIFIHSDGQIVFANTMGARLLGAGNPCELYGRAMVDFVHPDYLAAERERCDIILCNKEVLPMAEQLFVTLDGAVVPVEVACGPLLFGGKDAVQVIARDISERKRAQDEMIKSQKLESLGILAGGIAHDFNNILTGILGNLSFVRMQIDPAHIIAKRLVECEKAAVRASNLTQQLLTFSRGGDPVKKIADPASLIEEAVSFVLHGSNVKSIIKLDEKLWCMDANSGQVNRALHNLIINGAQAMPNGGELTISAANTTLGSNNPYQLPEGVYIKIAVEDKGCGIAQENLSRIFDPYFTTKPQGSGLGLTTTYSIVKKHGGTVTVSSTLGKGSNFTVYLPALSCPLPEDKELKEPVRISESKKILVMDDDAHVREISRDILEFIGYDVESCTNGEEAVELYREAAKNHNPFTAVILDLTVPGGMGGKEAGELILKIDSKAVMIVSSGYSNDPIMADYAAYGFSGAIPKPFRVETLAGDLEKLLS